MKSTLIAFVLIASFNSFSKTTNLGNLVPCVETVLTDYRTGVSQSDMWSSNPDFRPITEEVSECSGYNSSFEAAHLSVLVKDKIVNTFNALSSNFECFGISKCVYSVGHEYSFSYSMVKSAFNFSVANQDLILVMYHGYGGEWGREESRELYMILDQHGNIKVRNTLRFR